MDPIKLAAALDRARVQPVTPTATDLPWEKAREVGEVLARGHGGGYASFAAILSREQKKQRRSPGAP